MEKITIYPVYVEYPKRKEIIDQQVIESFIVVPDGHKHDSHFVIACDRDVLKEF